MENYRKKFNQRSNYIVMDCVADKFDHEVPFTKKKDYPMDLNRLDGIGSLAMSCGCNGADAKDLQGLGDTGEAIIERMYVLHDGRTIGEDAYGNQYEFAIEGFDGLGKISLKKIVKGVVNTVTDVAKVVTIPIRTPIKIAENIIQGDSLKEAIKDTVQDFKEDIKVVADGAGKVIRFINRFANPLTVLLRNGILLAMKINLFNVANRLRFAWWDDVTAKINGWETGEFERLKTVRDKLETIYWQAGGKKENLAVAILKGKGNKDERVPKPGDPVEFVDPEEADMLAGLPGLGYLSGLSGALGIVESGAAIAAASAAVAGIAKLLDAIKSPNGCKTLPEPPEPTGDAATDAMNESIYQATLVACKAQATINTAQSLLKTNTSTQTTKSTTQNTSSSSDSSPDTEKPFNWTPWLIGAGLLGGGYIFLKSATKKKKASETNGLGDLNKLPSKPKRKVTSRKAVRRKKHKAKVETVNF